jgi:5'(3')-deoxyribonucleotidase
MTKLCLLDMDCVLVDFIRASLDLHGFRRPVEEYWQSQMGGGYDYWTSILKISKEDFFAPMNEDWWANLPWTPEGKKILWVVERLFGRDNVVIVTHPTDAPGCLEGKRRWLKRCLPERYGMPHGHIFCADKWLLATPNRVLVDDHDLTVDEFARCGGKVCLVPRPHNRLWAARYEVIKYVASTLGMVD